MTKYTLNGNLYAPYQVDGVKWMLGMENQLDGPKGGFLCDEMGLGKTIQIIATILGNPKKNTLIVVPKTIVTQWSKELQEFAPGLSVLVYDGPKRTKEKNDLLTHDVVVCPYSVTHSKTSILGLVNWDRIILDEAHEIRNRQTRTFKSVNGLNSTIRWLVTGTPIFNSMEDFVTLCAFLGIPKNTVQAMHKQIKDIYIMRRTKADSSLDLPYCHFENIELDMYPEELALYECAFMECQESISQVMRTNTSVEARNMHILECLLRVRQLTIWPQLYLNGVAKKTEQPPQRWEHRTNKMDKLFMHIDSHPDEKAIVFCQFKGEMDYIEKSLMCTVFRIDGAVEKDERHKRLGLFGTAPSNSVLIIQIKCGGQGLNIQCATRVYIMSPSWNPSTELQAIGRCHRSGQTKEVHVKKFVYNDTQKFRSVDLAMMSLQGHKSVLCAEVLNDKRIEFQIPMKQEKSIDAIRKIFR
jgi:SNF2 family DNA or RNA helicase|tara:strand:- start:22545 stop:23948 length:1404 start_codon:yes stop_codon:yes gene_type:complete